jgi:hypothetical protein
MTNSVAAGHEISNLAIPKEFIAGVPPWWTGFDPTSDHGGICCGKSGFEVALFRALRFPLPILTPPTAPHSYIVLS